jgi:phosphatidylserine/phosphatidylglycerophosphate/cardiolipin synthase-like enzyme
VKLKRALLTLLLIVFVPAADLMSVTREPVMAGVRVFYGPAPGFEQVDPDIIAGAQTRIDMAAYVLTDRAVMAELGKAAQRGVKLRLYLDADQSTRNGNAARDDLSALARTPNVEVRMKASGHDMMHLKAYQVDGRVLRSGSANFSYAGEHRQDNDIVMIESRAAVAAFVKTFEAAWTRLGNQEFRGQ